MKTKIIIIATVCLTAWAGCKREPSASEQIDKLNNETKEAAQNMKDYTFAEKEEFVAQMQRQLTTLNQDLDSLAAKIEKSSDAVKADAKPRMQALRRQAAELEAQLDEAKKATDSTWDSIKSGTRKSYEALKDGFQQSRQWVSDKIAP